MRRSLGLRGDSAVRTRGRVRRGRHRARHHRLGYAHLPGRGVHAHSGGASARQLPGVAAGACAHSSGRASPRWPSACCWQPSPTRLPSWCWRAVTGTSQSPAAWRSRCILVPISLLMFVGLRRLDSAAAAGGLGHHRRRRPDQARRSGRTTRRAGAYQLSRPPRAGRPAAEIVLGSRRTPASCRASTTSGLSGSRGAHDCVLQLLVARRRVRAVRRRRVPGLRRAARATGN